MGGEGEQTAAGELAPKGTEPRRGRGPQRRAEAGTEERGAPRAVSETQLQGNPKHDAQGMEPKCPTPPPSAPRRRLAAKGAHPAQKSRQKGTEEAKPSALQEVNKQHLKTGNLKQKRNTEKH